MVGGAERSGERRSSRKIAAAGTANAEANNLLDKIKLKLFNFYLLLKLFLFYFIINLA